MAIILGLNYNIYTKMFYKGWLRKCLDLNIINLIILILKNSDFSFFLITTFLVFFSFFWKCFCQVAKLFHKKNIASHESFKPHIFYNDFSNFILLLFLIFNIIKEIGGFVIGLTIGFFNCNRHLQLKVFLRCECC